MTHKKKDQRIVKVITITPQESANMFGVPTGTLANLRWKGTGPRYYKIGRRILYRIEDVEAWIGAGCVQTLDSAE